MPRYRTSSSIPLPVGLCSYSQSQARSSVISVPPGGQLPYAWCRRSPSVLAPLHQAQIHTLISLHKHVIFGAWFGAIVAGYLLHTAGKVNPDRGWRVGAVAAGIGSLRRRSTGHGSVRLAERFPDECRVDTDRSEGRMSLPRCGTESGGLTTFRRWVARKSSDHIRSRTGTGPSTKC